MEKQFKEFEENLIVTKQLFYNENSMYGAYGFKFKDKVNPQIKLHPVYNNFSIAGNIPSLVEGKTYTVKFKEDYDERRQVDTYTFIGIKSEGIKGRDEQAKFLREILTAKQAQSILKEFSNEDIIGDILKDRIDLTLVKGIKNASATHIKLKLADANKYSEAIVKLSPIGVGVSNVVKLSEHFGSPEKLIHVAENNIYRLTEVTGFGFKRVDEYALNTGITKNDSRRIQAGALYVIDQIVSFGDTKIDINKFEEELTNILDIEEVSDETFNKILNNPEIYYKDGYISLKAYREEEKSIVEHLKRLRNGYTQKQIKTKETIKDVEFTQGFKFNDEQLEGINTAVENGVFILDGKAGSGKTSLLKAVVECTEGISKACSLSGKAAKVLSDNGLDSSTIHRLLVFDSVTGGFIYNIDNKLPIGTYILDEASMVDNRLFLSLISAIPTGSQFFIVGDSGQLPAIGRGAVFHHLLSCNEFAHVTLKQVHRQAQDSGTLSNANMVREGLQILKYNQEGVTVEGNNKDFYGIYFRDSNDILSEVIEISKRFKDNPNTYDNDFQVIAGLKEKGELSVLNLNKYLQDIFNPKIAGNEEIKGAKYVFRKGDRVIQQGNNYRAIGMTLHDFSLIANGFATFDEIETTEHQVFNGSFGKILSCIENVGMLVKIEDIETPIFYAKNENGNEIGVLDLGYAISVHRSQGSGFKNLLVVVSFKDFMLLSRQFLYTALTRTINNCFLVGESNAIHYATKTDKKDRNCFISEFLN